jgi:adenylate cyclase, class 2
MSYEIETKVLDIDKEKVIEKLESLGARKVQETRLIVDWYRPKGEKEEDALWFLRIRSNSEGQHEVTWKSKAGVSGIAKIQEEINFFIQEPKKLVYFFGKLGLEKYARQEKNRTSFSYKKYQFEIDEYPGVPAYLEIESDSENSIRRALKLLGLEDHRTWEKGERTLIQEVYGLDWYSMEF